MSVHAVDWASAAIDWRLFLPESWDEEKTTDEHAVAEIRRRARSAIPREVQQREKWRLALDMLDDRVRQRQPLLPVLVAPLEDRYHRLRALLQAAGPLAGGEDRRR